LGEPFDSLLLPAAVRGALWRTLQEIAESYSESVDSLSVAPVLDPARLRGFVRSFSFAKPLDPDQVFREIASRLIENQVHTASSGYFGLFNPASSTMSIFADALTAALNPQLAAWSHSPLAAEIEQHLVTSMGAKFGYAECDGTLATGGSEANQTALLTALVRRWPEVIESGLRGIGHDPVLYVSAEGHDSFRKVARLCGLGDRSVRRVNIGADLRMDLSHLLHLSREDRAAGREPFLVVGTAGTTAAGIIDPLQELAALTEGENLWFHVDAAWGGAAVLVPELRKLLVGIERADSITFDPHKWLSVAMGAGMFLTRDTTTMGRIFSLRASYMPKEGDVFPVIDPFTHSIQWSRRFSGLKLFLTLAVAGWDGYATVLRRQVEMGRALRAGLLEDGWRVENDTALPVVCFSDPAHASDMPAHQSIVNQVLAEGRSWISTVVLGSTKQPAIRACITNVKTGEENLRVLRNSLRIARSEQSQSTLVLPNVT
jgi:glutamate/tyrosine decarboxylase-like PLP-dependent enzyme